MCSFTAYRIGYDPLLKVLAFHMQSKYRDEQDGHSAKESVVLMYILYMERHAVEILRGGPSIKIWGKFSTAVLCRKYKNISVCSKST